jgi:hypothetical protein
MLNSFTCPPLIAITDIRPYSTVVMTGTPFGVVPGYWDGADPTYQDVPIIGVTDGSVSRTDTEFHARAGELVTLQTGLNVLVRAGTKGAAYSFWNAGKGLRLGDDGEVIPLVEPTQNQWCMVQLIALQRFVSGEVFWARRATGHPCISGL